MADEKNRKGDKGPKSGKTKRTVGTVSRHRIFRSLEPMIIIFPVFAGLLASFRPGTELIRRGLSIDLDIRTMNLDNYKYLFSGNADSQKYFMWYQNSLVITIVSVVLSIVHLLLCGIWTDNVQFQAEEFPLLPCNCDNDGTV